MKELIVFELQKLKFCLVFLAALLLLSFVIFKLSNTDAWMVSEIEIQMEKDGEDAEKINTVKTLKQTLGIVLLAVSFISLLSSGLLLIVFWLLRTKADTESGQLFLFLTSPRHSLLLQLYRFIVYYLLIAVYVITLTALLYYQLPAEISAVRGMSMAVFTLCGYILLSIVLPFFALLYLLGNINTAYHKQSRSLILGQFIGVYALVVHFIPSFILPLLERMEGVIDVSIVLPELVFENEILFTPEASTFAVEPLLLAIMASALFLWLAARVWDETEVQ